MATSEERIAKALEIAMQSGSVDGAHHKAWVLDQIVRALTDCPTVIQEAVDVFGRPYAYEALGESDWYRAWVMEHNDGEDGPYTYGWDTGIAP